MMGGIQMHQLDHAARHHAAHTAAHTMVRAVGNLRCDVDALERVLSVPITDSRLQEIFNLVNNQQSTLHLHTEALKGFQICRMDGPVSHLAIRVNRCLETIITQKTRLSAMPTTEDASVLALRTKVTQALELVETDLTDVQRRLPIQKPAAPAPSPLVIEKKIKVSPETIGRCLFDLVIGLPIYQLLSEFACSLTWCCREIWYFSIESLNLNPVKIALAAIPCMIGAVVICIGSLPLIVVKKVYDMGCALIGLLKPNYWIKEATDSANATSYVTKREKSSAWLQNMWAAVHDWARQWVAYVKKVQ